MSEVLFLSENEETELVKKCPKCNKCLPASRFGFNTIGGIRNYCFNCKRDYYKSKETLERKRKKYYNNKELYIKRVREYSKSDRGIYIRRLRSLKYLYNLTEESYRNLIECQHNSCFICGMFFDGTCSKTIPHIDHNHRTGAVRGILCANCNRAIGLFKEDIEVLKRAVSYIEKDRNNEEI